MDAEPQFWIKVLLLNDVNNCTLRINSPFSVLNQNAQIKQIHFDFNQPTEIKITAGKIAVGGWSSAGKEITISGNSPHIFNINGTDYRGKLQIILNPDSNSFDAINLIPLEPYLAGVVGSEMPAYWEPEALQTQAVAARTYCLYIKKRFGVNRHWDVKKTESNQVYRGLKAESAQIWDAVNQTKGQVLICKQAKGADDIFSAYYTSTCGGHTESSKNLFGGNFFEPLAGVLCSYCKESAKPKLFNWQEVVLDKKNVRDALLRRYPKLTQLGKITKIIPIRQSDYEDFSRLTMIKLIGSTGKSDVLRAEDFRLAVDSTGRKLKSTAFKIVDANDKWIFKSGRGFGHGVGMCQYGVQAMAMRGKTCEQILAYYYPGSKIKAIY